MIEKIKKCDRCKKRVDVLVNFKFVNSNATIEKEDNEIEAAFASWFSIQPDYPTGQAELCYECTATFIRWIGHPENELYKSKDKQGGK